MACITYNQQDYIAKALESILSQVTDFDYEILVHDDASTDGTGSIVEELSEKYPGRIKYIRQSENKYSQGVRIVELALSYVSGDFIAYCEGDDFWADDDKLQKQYDYLLSNPRCGAVFGDANIYIQGTGVLIRAHDSMRCYVPPSGDVRRELLLGNPYKSCTAMFRKIAVEGYAAHAEKLHAKMDDYVMWLCVCLSYEIYYMPDVLATYRVLPHSASHFLDWRHKVRFDRSTYKVAVYFNRLMGGGVDNKKIRSGYAYSLFSFFLGLRQFSKAFHYFEFSSCFCSLFLGGVKRKVAGFIKKTVRSVKVLFKSDLHMVSK